MLRQEHDGPVSGPYLQPEAITDAGLASFDIPTGWWEAEAVVIRGGTEPELVYLLSGIGLNPLQIQDTRRRRLIEAFTALPLTATAEAVRDYWRTRKRAVDLFRAQAELRRRALDLVLFVETFGPFGMDWEAQLPLRDPTRGTALDPVGRPYIWIADFGGLGAGRFGWGALRRVMSPPENADLIDRLRADPTAKSDRLDMLLSVQQDLVSTLRLAKLVLDQGSDKELQSACRAATHATSKFKLTLDLPKSSPWHRALRGEYAHRATLEPFGDDLTFILWPEFARLTLSELITRQLGWLHLRVEVLPDGRFVRSVRPTSLVEFMYLQLLERLEQRRQLGIDWCTVCGGVRLPRRRRDLGKEPRHPGCGNVARVAKYRARRRDGSAPR